jgi:hypothetical protein
MRRLVCDTEKKAKLHSRRTAGLENCKIVEKLDSIKIVHENSGTV